MKCFLMITGFLLLSACLKINNLSDKKDEQDFPSSIRLEAEKRTQVIFSAIPNSYQVQIPRFEHAPFIRRSELDSQDISSNSQYLDLKSEGGYFLDGSMSLGKKYLYEIGHLENGTFHSVRQDVVSIPQDLVIESLTLNQDTVWNQYRRIYLKKDSVLTTLNYQLSIQAEEVISEHGLIRTFPDANEPGGRSGSRISMRLKTASGNLEITLAGEKGNKGKIGQSNSCDARGYADGGAATDGEVGGNGGDSGQILMTISEPHQLQVQIQSRAGTAGEGGEPGATCYGPPARMKGPSGNPGSLTTSCIEDFRGRTCFP